MPTIILQKFFFTCLKRILQWGDVWSQILLHPLLQPNKQKNYLKNNLLRP